MIRAVLFDLWDTLAYMTGIAEVVQQMRDALGPERTAALRPIMAQWHREAMSTDEVVDLVREQGALVAEQERLLRARLEFGVMQLYPDTLPTLEALRRRGRKVGLLSNSPESTGKQIRSMGLVPLFDTVCLSYESGFLKPEPEFFALAAKGLGIPIPEILMVGDSQSSDIDGALGVGMSAVQIDRTAAAPTEGIITDLTQLLALPELAAK